MNLVFNELSASDLAPDAFTARRRMSSLIQDSGQLFEQGFERLTVSDRFFETTFAENYTVNDWLADLETNSIEKNLLPGMIRYPYIAEPEEEASQVYITNNILLDEPSHSKHGEHGEGLATCWIKNELSFSLNSHPVWCKASIGLDIHPDGGAPLKARVPNICTIAQFFGEKDIQDWFALHTQIKLVNKSDIQVKYPAPAYQFSEQALTDIGYWIEENRPDYVEKIEGYLQDIRVTPFHGKGKPEPLKGDYAGWWSRRITDGDRFIYKVENGILHVLSAKGHYGG